MLRNKLIYLAVIIASFLHFIAHEGWISSFLLCVVLIIPLLSYLISLLLFRSSIDVNLDEDIKYGEATYIKVKSKAILSNINNIELKVYNHFYDYETKESLRRENDEFILRYWFDHVGLYSISINKVESYDLLKIFKIPSKYPVSKDILIYPKEIRIEGINLDKKFAVRLVPRRGKTLSEDYDLRPYQMGDISSDVHWKLSAKKDDIIVKESLIDEKDEVDITFEVSEDKDNMDNILGKLEYLSNFLIKRKLNHTIYYYDKHLETYPIETNLDKQLFFSKLLSHKLSSVHTNDYVHSDNHFHIERGHDE